MKAFQFRIVLKLKVMKFKKDIKESLYEDV